MSIFDALKSFDEPTLRFLNVTMASPALDRFWLTITQAHKLWWTQSLVFPALLVAFFAKYRAQALKPLVMVALAVAVSDAVCYRVIKRAVGRPRPFETVGVSSWVRKVGDAHGSSFPSNHAANCFAAAGVWAYYFGRWRRYAFGLATVVALSRPALGVHFPSDVVVGAWVGMIVAFLINSLVIARARKLRLVAGETSQSGDWRKRFSQPPAR